MLGGAVVILAGCLSRHGASCLCRYCTPSHTEINARLDLARSHDDMAMIAKCRDALTGDRRAMGTLVDALAFESLMGGAR
jgi:hypothetical protein